VRRVQLSGFAPLTNPIDADRQITRLRSRFRALHDRRSARYVLTLVELLCCSRHRRKTLDFLRRSAVWGEDFTNIGGMDLQFSHLIDFHPSFTLGSAVAEQ